MLLFWDSDIIMEPDAIEELMRTEGSQKADIVTADASFISTGSVDDVEEKVEEAMKLEARENWEKEVTAAGMGHTLVSRRVLNSVRFDSDLTTMEDYDSSIRAREKGFRIVMNRGIRVFDVNVIKKENSDIHINMPLKSAMRGIRKKSKAQVRAYKFRLTLTDMVYFFLRNKRYVFYLCYVPMGILTTLGVFLHNIYLIVVFPLYLLFFTCGKCEKEGWGEVLKRGMYKPACRCSKLCAHHLLFYEIHHKRFKHEKERHVRKDIPQFCKSVKTKASIAFACQF